MAEELNPGDDDDPLTQASTHAAAAAAHGSAQASMPAVLGVLRHICVPGAEAPAGLVLNAAGATIASLQVAALRCLAVWAPLGVTVGSLQQAGLLEAVVHFLSNPDTIGDVADVLVASIAAAKHRQEPVDPTVISVIMQQTVAQAPLVTAALTADEDDWMDSVDACLGIARLATEIAKLCSPSQLAALPGAGELMVACLR